MLKIFSHKLFLICMLAFVLRAGFVFEIKRTLQPDSYATKKGTDMHRHLESARHSLAGEFKKDSVSFSPLMPVAILPVLLFVGGGVFGAMLIQAGIGAVNVGLIGAIARRFFGEKTALLSAALSAFYTVFILYNAFPLTETTINFTVLLSFLMFLRFRQKPSLKTALFTGLAWGLCITAKPNMVILPVLLLLGDAFERGWQKTRADLTKLWPAGITVILVLAPFMYRAHALTGELLFLRSEGGFNVLIGNNPTSTGTFRYPSGEYGNRFNRAVEKTGGRHSAKDRVALKWAARFWLEHPKKALRLLLTKTILFLSPDEINNNVSVTYLKQVSFLGFPFTLSSSALWPLAILGLLVNLARIRKLAVPLVFTIGYSAAMVIFFFVVARYRLPVLPFILMAGAAGITWFFNPGIKRSGKIIAGTAVLTGITVFNLDAVCRIAVPVLSPLGQRDRWKEGLTLVHEGSLEVNPLSPWRSTISDPKAKLVKIIRLAPREIPDNGTATLVFIYRALGQGSVTISINGHEKDFPVTDKNAGRIMLGQADISAVVLKEKNVITFSVSKGVRFSLFMNDDYSYGRSKASFHGEDPGLENPDVKTLKKYRGAHIPRGEFMVGLLIPSADGKN